MVIGTAKVGGLLFFFAYYGSPKYTDVGYQPDQPIDYSHKFHVGTLGLDCRYCHSFVETSSEANIPATEKCMNCHQNIQKKSDELEKLKDSWKNQESIEWVQIHMLPDYAYFNHSVHLNVGQQLVDKFGNGKWDEGEEFKDLDENGEWDKGEEFVDLLNGVWDEGDEYEALGVGIGCVECHGRVDQMEVVQQVEPLSMSWCLDCHRDPAPYLRPISEITNMGWKSPDSWKDSDEYIKIHKTVVPSQDCSACHR